MTDTHDVVPHADQLRAKTALHPLVQAAMGANPTPETLEKMLGLQERWEANEAKRAFTAAKVELQRDLPTIISRDATVDYTSQKGRTYYKHASLGHVYETIRPHLVNHGFSLAFRAATTADKVSVTAILTHRGGHSEESTITAPPDASGNKNGAQAVASTITLLQRYTALALLGIATADMIEPGDEETETAKHDGRVDSAKNMRALTELVKAGKTKEEVEKYVGRPVQQWTASDLAKLRAWITPPPPPPPKQDEPRPTPAEPEIVGPAKPASKPTEEMRKALSKAAKENGWQEFQFKAKLAELGGWKSTAEIPGDKFQSVMEYFRDVDPSGKVKEQSELPI